MSHINSESLDTPVGPEFEGLDEIVPDFLVVPIEVWLRGVEEVEVKLTISYWFPGGTTEDTDPVGWSLVFLLTESCYQPYSSRVGGRRGRTVTEDIPVPSGRSDRRFQSFLEPNVIITRMVGDDVNHDLNTGLVECIHHDIKVFEGTNFWVDISVVGNVIYSSVSPPISQDRGTYNHHPLERKGRKGIAKQLQYPIAVGMGLSR
jgi:hypothetical protein